MRITNEQNDIAEVLFSQEMIKQRVDELAVELTTDYEQKDGFIVFGFKKDSEEATL